MQKRFSSCGLGPSGGLRRGIQEETKCRRYTKLLMWAFTLSSVNVRAYKLRSNTRNGPGVRTSESVFSPGSLGDLIRFWVSAALLDLGPEPQQGGRTTANIEWDRCLHSWSLKQKSHICLCFSCRNKSTQKGGLLLLRLHVCSYRLYSDCWYTVVLHKYYSRSTTGGTAQEHSTTECRRSVTR